jgi:hypothetical protein
MKTIALEKTNLNKCVADSQSHRIVLTRDGVPVALVVGVAGLDQEQIELGASGKFWKLVQARRKEKTMSRAELENAIKAKVKRKRS